MSSNLLIVESPAKSRTLKKYLGPDFEIMASYGHVRDLVPKEGAVDTDNGFAMKYEIIDRNRKHVSDILRRLKGADNLYLATDPDREGEAISWHLYEILKEKKALKDKNVYRVVFHEITKRAVQEAIAHPRRLSDDLVNAQQARRALDYLVGFNLSPLLWRKVSGGLSAGRVQSPALRLIVEREEEIEAFQSREYWTIEAQLEKDATAFTAKLIEAEGARLEQFDITGEEHARRLCRLIEEGIGAAESSLVPPAEQDLAPPADAPAATMPVVRCEKKQRKRRPPPPFITPTLQQEGARKLRFRSSHTMRIAQQLYEGVDLGSGPVGLITYMRTDSVTLAREAIDDLRNYIASRFGDEQLPAAPNLYKTRSKNAQEAHEAIRPTSASRAPQDIRAHLSGDQFRLYDLIWKRAVACQMIPATLDTVSVDFAGGDGFTFRATGSTVREPGFMMVYTEGRDEVSDAPRNEDAGEDANKAGAKEKKLPALEEGDAAGVRAIVPEQHFTEPPPRYNEATLIKTLEEYGIGRPSTYASIISTLQNREYATLDNRRFQPTPTGRLVNRFLTEHFTQYVDYDFTARLEDSLDAVSRGEKDWVPLLDDFWHPFKQQVEDKASISKQEAALARELGVDPKTGKPVFVRYGRYGPFAQIGSADDDEKPRFASLTGELTPETVTLEQALELFKLPRELGETPQGEQMLAGIGRFGPYIKYGAKYVSIRDDDPYTISAERALQLVEEKKREDEKKLILNFADEGISVLNGRYGPYVTDGAKNASVPKDREPSELTLDECRELIANAPARRRTAKKGAAKKGARKKTAKKSTAKKAPPKKKTAATAKKRRAATTKKA